MNYGHTCTANTSAEPSSQNQPCIRLLHLSWIPMKGWCKDVVEVAAWVMQALFDPIAVPS